MKKSYGVVLIGCGHIGEQHIQEIYDKREATIIATVDFNIETAKSFAARFEAESYGTDYRPYLDDPRVEIVIIATYTDTHFPIMRDCILHGKHVICEKPIATCLDDAREFVRLVKSSNCKVSVSHVLRYNRSYRKIKELIDAGEIGDLRMVRMNQSHRAGEAGHPWDRFIRLMQDCPPLIDCGVHYADVIQWFADSPIVAVSGISAKTDIDAPCDNYQVMLMELKNGCRGYYEVGWSNNISSNNDKDFIGTKGHITLTMAMNRTDGITDKDRICIYYGDENKPDVIMDYDSVYKDMYGQFLNLIDMIENDAPGAVPIDAVYTSYRTVSMAYEAIKQGKRIVIPDESDLLANV
ncbi:MAG: Gfo/Idh/MocA family oxidoreductase [Loktanella sp.]|nr:Gfo/Idh/MocA family oxidoreductase [Loktanella sp.]